MLDEFFAPWQRWSWSSLRPDSIPCLHSIPRLTHCWIDTSKLRWPYWITYLFRQHKLYIICNIERKIFFWIWAQLWSDTLMCIKVANGKPQVPLCQELKYLSIVYAFVNQVWCHGGVVWSVYFFSEYYSIPHIAIQLQLQLLLIDPDFNPNSKWQNRLYSVVWAPACLLEPILGGSLILSLDEASSVILLIHSYTYSFCIIVCLYVSDVMQKQCYLINYIENAFTK